MSNEFYAGRGLTVQWPNVPSAMELTFADVTISAGDPTTDGLNPDDIESRTQADLTTEFGPWTLKAPIITAPMDTVSGPDMIREVAKLGGIGTLPRYDDQEEMLRVCKQLATEGLPFVPAIGLSHAVQNAKDLQQNGASMVLIDIANGYVRDVALAAKAIQESLGLPVIAGNITTYRGAQAYKDHGVIFQRVGIGPGAMCTTREKTGIGTPQLSAIFDTHLPGVTTIADGGIKRPGDAAKALAAGGKLVMIGSLFAGTDESPGDVEMIEGVPHKKHRGQASASYMHDHGKQLTEYATAEGVTVYLPVVGPVAPIFNDILAGIRSSMLYVGATNLQEYYEKTIFNRVSAAAFHEGQAHIHDRRNIRNG